MTRQVEAPDLPTAFTLPVSGNLPKFDFHQSSASNKPSEQQQPASSQRPVFVTSSPIGSDKPGSRGSSAAAAAAFVFSSPIAQAGNNVAVSAPRETSPVSAPVAGRRSP